MKRFNVGRLRSVAFAIVALTLTSTAWADDEDGDGDQLVNPAPEGEPPDEAAPDPGYAEPGGEPVGEPEAAQQEPVRVAVGATFYDALNPYGQWHYSSTHGWVWSPRRDVVGAGFRPYVTSGDWVHSNEGWMFNSNHTWGWVPFHYGRWYRDPSYGWSWVPGNQWAPAWVDWRHGAGHVGWAPLGPVGYSLSQDAWAFVGDGDLGRPMVARYVLPYHRWRPYYSRTVLVRRAGTRWSYGPPVDRYRGVRRVHINAPRFGVAARVHYNGTRVVVRPYGSVRINRHYRPAGYRPGRPGYPAARAGYPAARPGYPARHYPAARAGYPAARPGYSGHAPAQPGYRRGGYAGQPRQPAPSPRGYGRPVGTGRPAGYGRPAGTGRPAGYGRPAGTGQPAGYGRPAAGTGRSAGRGGQGSAEDENNRRRRGQGGQVAPPSGGRGGQSGRGQGGRGQGGAGQGGAGRGRRGR